VGALLRIIQHRQKLGQLGVGERSFPGFEPRRMIGIG
jgi:hypothetical protein